MSRQRPLRGACSCGRNVYEVVVPTSATEQAHVSFDDSSSHRRAQATPLTAWLRVPIAWVSSSTVAQFHDETHSTIRKVFTPPHEPHCKRFFCGFCGTHLSYWTEDPPTEADYLSITLGSLLSEDIRALQELELLPEDVAPEQLSAGDEGVVGQDSRVTTTSADANTLSQRSMRSGRFGGLDWFEELIDGSRLGRTQKTRRGAGLSADGTTQVSWEISEYIEGDENEASTANSTSKRKHVDVADDEDVSMKQ